MSAHPHLKANRASSARGGGGGGGRQRVSAAAAADTVGGTGGPRDGRRRVAPPPPRDPWSGMDADSDVSRGVLLGGAKGAAEEGPPEELGGFEAGEFSRGDDDGSTLSDSGRSLEPGQARSPPVRRSWQEGVTLASAEDVGVSSGRDGAGDGERFGLGAPWLRHRNVAASEDTAYSAGEASSGAELGEQDLDDFAVEEQCGEEDRASRPLKALAVGTGSSATRR